MFAGLKFIVLAFHSIDFYIFYKSVTIAVAGCTTFPKIQEPPQNSRGQKVT
jgi:hypothetical protein